MAKPVKVTAEAAAPQHCSASLRPGTSRLQVPTLQHCWPSVLASFLGSARQSQPLACASRNTAGWLICGSITTLAGSRKNVKALSARPDIVGATHESFLSQLQVQSAVMRALVPVLGLQRCRVDLQSAIAKVQFSAAEAAAMLNSLRAQR